jgi:hypothetical protein
MTSGGDTVWEIKNNFTTRITPKQFFEEHAVTVVKAPCYKSEGRWFETL